VLYIVVYMSLEDSQNTDALSNLAHHI